MMTNLSHGERRHGVTLIELLVVIFILSLLAAVAVPAMRPALEGRRIRESARGINMFFASAQSRAKELGRPCGVSIRRFDGQPECAMVLELAEVPPPYAGDVTDAVIRLQDWTMVPDPLNSTALVNYWSDGSVIVKARVHAVTDPLDPTGLIIPDLSDGVVRRGDRIQLNHQGPVYTIVKDRIVAPDPANPVPLPDFRLDGNGFIEFSYSQDNRPQDEWIDSHELTLRLDPRQAGSVPWPKVSVNPNRWSSPVPFAIIRRPMKSATAPLQLPSRAVIDLEFSGTDPVDPLDPTSRRLTLGWAQSADDAIAGVQGALESVTIMFSPDGSADRLLYHQRTIDPLNLNVLYVYGEVALVEPIFLLIGKRDKVPSAPGEENFRDLTNLWMTLNPQTGRVTTSEIDMTPDPAIDDVFESRALAREAQPKGGR